MTESDRPELPVLHLNVEPPKRAPVHRLLRCPRCGSDHVRCTGTREHYRYFRCHACERKGTRPNTFKVFFSTSGKNLSSKPAPGGVGYMEGLI